MTEPQPDRPPVALPPGYGAAYPPPPYPYPAGAWPPPLAPSPPPRRRGRGPRLLLVVLLVAGLAVGGWYLRPAPEPRVPEVSAPTEAQVQAPRTFPTPGHEAAGQPLGTPPEAPASDVYAFVERQDDGLTPVAYDPCRPIAVVISLDGAPAGAEAMLADALARLSVATGLQFRDEGATDEVSTGDRPAYQPDRYGDRWAPVLVGWRTPEQDPALAGDVAGLGGSASASPEGGPEVYVTGRVTLDGPEFEQLLADGNTDLARAILLHELGHVVGLAHVWDDTQLMASSTTGEVLDYADGDLAGLARLGAGACVPEL